jgi:ubiquinone/menaquinone biosynthesis C-methylase UbiE
MKMFSQMNNYFDEQKMVDRLFNDKAVYWAKIYDEKSVYAIIHQQRLTFALNYVDELSIRKTSPILEIGCGAGFMAIELAKRGFEVEATDNVPAMIKQTEKNAKQNNVENRIHTAIANIHKLSYKDESFELIVALGVIPWIPNLRQALSEVSRVLKPGGFAVLNVINRFRLNQIFDPLCSPAFESTRRLLKRELTKIGLRHMHTDATIHLYSIKELIAYLQEVNLINIKNVNFGFGPFTFLRQNLFKEEMGIKIQQRLQSYANIGFPVFRSIGSQYVILVRKN